jgi:hypothetical protein
MSLSSVASRGEASRAGAAVVRLKPRHRSTPERPIDVRLDRAGFAAAAHVVRALAEGEAGSVHPPTIIAVLATFAAENALRAAAVERRASLDQTPSGWIVGGPADAILFDCGHGGRTTVWDLILSGALEAGLLPDTAPDMSSLVADAEAIAGVSPYPVYSVPPSHRPRGMPRAAAARLRHDLLRHAADEGLCTSYECALVGGAAIGNILRHDPAPAMLTHLAAQALISAARQVPLPFAVR